MTIPRHPRSLPAPAIALLVVLAVLALLPHVRIADPILDDSYITFRYAANLAHGHGLVYNVGERVLGTTTPAWAVILGAIGAVLGAGAIPAAARVLAGLLVAATGLIAGRAAHRATGSGTAAVLVAATFLIGPHALYGGVAGMESPLFMLTAVLALATVSAGRWTLAAVFAGLSPLVRPEGLFLVAVVGAAWWLHARRLEGASMARTATALLLPGALLAAACWTYYGSPLPHSIVAKRAGLYPFTVLDSYRLVRDDIAILFPGGPTLAGILGGVPLFAVLALGSWRLIRAPWRLWPAMALMWMLIVFYGTSKTLLFPHYFALMEPWALLAWGAAMFAVAEGIAERATRARLERPTLIVALLGLVLAIPSLADYPLASAVVGRISAVDRVFPPTIRRMAVYAELARDLGPVLPAGTVALLPEIGVLGFEMPDLRVLDAAGLVSPQAIPHLPVPPEERGPPGVGAIPPSLVEAEHPDLVITLELFAYWGLYEQPWFDRDYEVVNYRYDDRRLLWGALRVHARRGWPGADAIRALPGGVPRS